MVDRAAPSGSDVATFGTAPNTTIDTPTTSIGTIQFGQSADSYYFGVGNTFAVTGGGILNGSSNVQIFYIDGALNFTGGTITGAVDIYNDSALSYANASAGSANIFNFTSATVDFNADSSAGNATISNGSFATINFNGGSTAGTSTISAAS